MTVLVYPDPETLAKVTAARLCLALADATALREEVHLAIAGGSVGTSVLGAIPDSELAGSVNWASVHVWWVDERFVPMGHADRNDAAVLPGFAALGIPDGNIHSMPSPAQTDDVAAGAAQYAATLADYAPEGEAMPLFDVVLLGMGPDGHIASLFPGHSGLDVDSAGEPETVAFGVTDSPKPPAERISLSLAAVNHTRNMWLAAWGAEKAPAIAAGVAGTAISEIPAAGARGQMETLWLTDLAGSANL